MQIPPLPEIPEFLRGRNFVTIDAAILGDRAFGAEVGPGAARPRARDRHLRHGAAGRAVAAAQRPGGADAGHDRAPAAGRPAGRGGRRLPGRRRPGLRLEADDGRDPPPRRRAARDPSRATARSPRSRPRYLFFGGGLAATPEMVAGLEAALPRFKAAMAEWDAGRGYLNFEETGRLTHVLRRGHPPAPAPHQDAGRSGRHLHVQPPDRSRGVAVRDLPSALPRSQSADLLGRVADLLARLGDAGVGVLEEAAEALGVVIGGVAGLGAGARPGPRAGRTRRP